MGEVYEKLRDVESLKFRHNKSELDVEYNLLTFYQIVKLTT
jgi:hypothetical protein